MIVDIRKFIYDKLYNHEDDRMENTNYKALRNIWDYISIYNLGINGELTTFSEKVNFKKQIGGTAFSIKLKDNKTYTYHLDKITSLNKKNMQHELCFLNLNEDSKCLCFSFHTKETGIDVLKLEDLIIYDNVEYIECDDPIHKFKSGDILVQILIELVKTNESFSHIKIIEAQDNSVKRCHGIGIQLKYMRTITDAIPYYAKFGFLPQKKSDNMVFEYNKNIYMETHKNIKSVIFDNLFLRIKEDNKTLYNFYKLTYRDSILNSKRIEYILFIRKLIDIDKDKKISKSNKKLNCELIAEIIKPLYALCGYKEYNTDMWLLKIKRKYKFL
jgi:hypothetical protein